MPAELINKEHSDTFILPSSEFGEKISEPQSHSSTAFAKCRMQLYLQWHKSLLASSLQLNWTLEIGRKASSAVAEAVWAVDRQNIRDIYEDRNVISHHVPSA